MYKLLRLLIAFILLSPAAWAGTLQVQERVNWIPPRDHASIRAAAEASPFDVRILVESVGSLSELEGDAQALVNRSNALVIAVDPIHHKTVTRFGPYTSVKVADYSSIASAGNTSFRSNEVGSGFVAIITRSRASAQASTAITSQPGGPIVIQEGLSWGAWFGIILGFCLLVGFIVWLARKHKREREGFERALTDNRLETSELVSLNIRRAEELDFSDLDKEVAVSKPFAPRAKVARAHVAPKPAKVVKHVPARHDPVYTTPAPVRQAYVAPAPVYVAPAPVYHNLLGDLATGMLVNEALHSHRDREVVRETIIREPSHQSSSWDSGSSSSYSSDSGSSSSWDSGSSSDSSSSWDSSSSGSSSDWGGGGGGDSSW